MLEGCLRAVSVPSEGLNFPEVIELKKDCVKLGRSPASCDVCFVSTPKVVSRLHTSVTANENGWVIKDEGSLNGTFVNGQKLESLSPSELQPGDVISFGPSWSTGGKLRYRYELLDGEDDETDVEDNIEETELMQTESAASSTTEPTGAPSSSRSPCSFLPFSCSSTSSSPTGCGMKRRRSEGEPCPFSSLMRIVKQHAKKLCIGPCKGKTKEVMAAASAACNAVTKAQETLEHGEDGTPKEQMLVDDCSKGGVKSEYPCMPLVDGQGTSNCVPLEVCPAKNTPKETELLMEANLSKKISELRSELSCAICQEPFLCTRTLKCGHSFCEPCIDSWLSKALACPLCRAPVDKVPISSRTIDKAVEVTLKSNSKTAWEGLVTRKEEYSDQLLKELERKGRLVEKLELACQKGHKFVHIARPWSKREQCRFLKGLSHFKGASREAFCRSVSLTPCFVQRASVADLAVAASNVKLANAENMDAEQLRNRMTMFLRYS